MFTTYSTKTYVPLHFEHKNDVTIIVKLLNAASSSSKFDNTGTAIFIMVVSPAVLAHDVLARTSDVSMGVAVASFLLAGFTQCHSKNWGTVKLRQRTNSVQPIRKTVKSPKHVKLRVDT